MVWAQCRHLVFASLGTKVFKFYYPEVFERFIVFFYMYNTVIFY